MYESKNAQVREWRISVSQTTRGTSHEAARSVRTLLRGIETAREVSLVVSKERAMCAVFIFASFFSEVWSRFSVCDPRLESSQHGKVEWMREGESKDL